jgi:hypothetical protein
MNDLLDDLSSWDSVETRRATVLVLYLAAAWGDTDPPSTDAARDRGEDVPTQYYPH